MLALNQINTKQTNNYSKYTVFKSKNYPLSPFTIKTQTGKKLFAQEMNICDLDNTLDFLLDVLLKSVKSWEHLRNPSQEAREMHLKYLKKFLTNCINKEDGNSTILIAKDQEGKIKAFVDMQYFDEIDILAKDGFKDLKTGYIQNCYTDLEYRNQGVGKIMLNKILTTAQNYFTDVFLCSEIAAQRFYEKNGFSLLDKSNLTIKKVTDYILKIKNEENSVIPMSKSIDPDNPWWERMAKLLK